MTLILHEVTGLDVTVRNLQTSDGRKFVLTTLTIKTIDTLARDWAGNPKVTEFQIDLHSDERIYDEQAKVFLPARTPKPATQVQSNQGGGDDRRKAGEVRVEDGTQTMEDPFMDAECRCDF